MESTADIDAIVAEIACEFSESRPETLERIRNIVQQLGLSETKSLILRAREIHANGGMKIADGSRNRTRGGVFFALAKGKCPGRLEAELAATSAAPLPVNHFICKDMESVFHEIFSHVSQAMVLLPRDWDRRQLRLDDLRKAEAVKDLLERLSVALSPSPKPKNPIVVQERTVSKPLTSPPRTPAPTSKPSDVGFLKTSKSGKGSKSKEAKRSKVFYERNTNDPQHSVYTQGYGQTRKQGSRRDNCGHN